MKNTFSLMKLGYVFILGVAVQFAGCSSSKQMVAAYPYGQLCSAAEMNDSVADLKSDGITVNYLGDYIYLIFSADNVFPVLSDQLKNTALLNDVAHFLKCQQKIAVQIVVYSNILKNPAEDMAFSMAQAQRIMRYLWRQGIDARFLTARGAGQSQAGSPSRRVEISMKKLP